MNSNHMSPVCHLAPSIAPLSCMDMAESVEATALDALIVDQTVLQGTPGGSESRGHISKGGSKNRALNSIGGIASHHRPQRPAQNFLS